MKILQDFVIVKVPSVFIDETRYKGVNGIQLLTNVSYNPERHIRCFGVVTSIPDVLFTEPLINNHIGAPGYHEDQFYSWKTSQDIELEVREGDKVYFHFNSLLPDIAGGSIWNKMFIMSKDEMENGKKVKYYYFKVRYSAIYASVRYDKANTVSRHFEWWMESSLKKLESFSKESNRSEELFHFTDIVNGIHTYKKVVTMIGSYVFVEPDMETWDEISIPVPEIFNGKPLQNPDGSIRLKPKEQWIVKKMAPEERYLRGWVRYVGTPLKGDAGFVEAGDYVWFQRYANTKLLFEGKQYFRMRQRHIFGVTKQTRYATA